MTTKLQRRAEQTAKLLTDLTGRTWLPMADERKDRYAYGCGFIVYDRDVHHRMFIFDPHGHSLAEQFSHTVPVWAFSRDSGDLWAAMSTYWSINDLLEQPGVLDAASGRPSPELPRDYRERLRPRRINDMSLTAHERLRLQEQRWEAARPKSAFEALCAMFSVGIRVLGRVRK